MKKLILSPAFLLIAAVTGQAQISYYKTENGKKTPLKEGEKFEIAVNADQKAQTNPNLVVEIDLAAFQEKYNYDHIRIRLRDAATDYSYACYPDHAKSPEAAYACIKFADPVFKKKYAGVKTLQFYLFKTDETNAANSFALIRWAAFDPSYETNNYQLILEGGYIKGEEEYYDAGNQSWKKRDIFSDFERVVLFSDVKFKMSDEWRLNDKFKRLVTPGDRRSVDDAGKPVRGLDIMVYILSKQVKSLQGSFKQIPVAIAAVSEHMKKNVAAETDKTKAIDLVVEWNKKAVWLVTDKMDPSALKALNKALKTVTDPEAIIAAFKKHNPNAEWPG